MISPDTRKMLNKRQIREAEDEHKKIIEKLIALVCLKKPLWDGDTELHRTRECSSSLSNG